MGKSADVVGVARYVEYAALEMDRGRKREQKLAEALLREGTSVRQEESTPEEAAELKAQQERFDALANEYAQRTRREMGEVTTWLEEKKIVEERGRWRRPSHYFQDEEEELRFGEAHARDPHSCSVI